MFAPFRRSLSLVILLGVASSTLAQIEVLLPPPSPLPTAWRIAGLRDQDFLPATVLDHLARLVPEGPRILECLRENPVGVAFLPSRVAPSALVERLAAQGYPEWSVLVGGDPTARWVQGPGGGLILVRVDQLLQERGAGRATTLPGLLAHELTHLGQRSWGALDPEGKDFDQRDEAEALWMERRVDQRTIRTKRAQGIRPSRQETGLLGVRQDAGQLARTLTEVQGLPRYRSLPAGPRGAEVPGKPDPFRPLWMPQAQDEAEE